MLIQTLQAKVCLIEPCGLWKKLRTIVNKRKTKAAAHRNGRAAKQRWQFLSELQRSCAPPLKSQFINHLHKFNLLTAQQSVISDAAKQVCGC